MKRLIFITIVCLCPLLVAAQRLLRGKIMEKETSTPICGACIAVKGTKQKTLSDKAGDYQLTVPTAGAYTIEVSAVGYKRLREVVAASGDVTRDYYLEPSSTSLREVGFIRHFE